MSDLQAHMDAATFQLSELLDALHEVPHPQEFGMENCQICHARDDAREALELLQAAQNHLDLSAAALQEETP